MNIINILEENAQLFAKSPAVIDCNNNRCLNYGDLWHKVNAAAYGLMSIGVGAGDRVALYLNNGVEFIIAYLAILRLGAIAVPFNIQLKRCEIKRILQSSEAKVIIGANKELNQEVKPIRKDVPNLITTIGVGQHDEENLIDVKFEDLLNENGTVPKVELEDDQPAAIHFTSGTLQNTFYFASF
jgi:acyl-CoA synthetase (AMP-forming)/AMP-acid ligase II